MKFKNNKVFQKFLNFKTNKTVESTSLHSEFKTKHYSELNESQPITAAQAGSFLAGFGQSRCSATLLD